MRNTIVSAVTDPDIPIGREWTHYSAKGKYMCSQDADGVITCRPCFVKVGTRPVQIDGQEFEEIVYAPCDPAEAKPVIIAKGGLAALRRLDAPEP